MCGGTTIRRVIFEKFILSPKSTIKYVEKFKQFSYVEFFILYVVVIAVIIIVIFVVVIVKYLCNCTQIHSDLLADTRTDLVEKRLTRTYISR